MTDSNRTTQDRTDDIRRATKTVTDRIDAIAEEVTRARGRLGKRFQRVEKAVTELDEQAEGPSAKVASAIDEFAAEARRSFERILTRKRPRRFFFF
jgi:predicted  nucleic acid-binding Zn-ribbon protein